MQSQLYRQKLGSHLGRWEVEDEGDKDPVQAAAGAPVVCQDCSSTQCALTRDWDIDSILSKKTNLDAEFQKLKGTYQC